MELKEEEEEEECFVWGGYMDRYGNLSSWES